MSVAAPEDLTVDNLTSHVIASSSYSDDERAKFVISKLIRHCHDFVRETNLTTPEWEMAWQYMTAVSEAVSLLKLRRCPEY